MGSVGRKIVGMDIDKLLTLLNKAYADEWLAYYQYWVGAKVVRGPMKEAVIAELDQHAADELNHATLLSARIIQLGGTPLLTPQEWYKMTNCGYDAPSDPFVRTVVEQNVKGEQCAIAVYKKMMDLTEGKDMVTYNLALQIMQDEVEHEEDLQALLEDFDMLLKSVKRGK